MLAKRGRIHNLTNKLMAEYTGKENIDEQKNTESHCSKEEIIKPETIENNISNQQIENMEVHHHTHPSHGKKTWKEYIWEFIMLFLAVFCGFLAEYQLEHLIENQREKKYIQALLEETRMDIKEYDDLIKRIYYIDPIADSLFHNVKMAEKYNFNLVGEWNAPFNNANVSYFPSLTAIRQLEHSGNLRLIKNQELLQKIVVYETSVEGNLKDSGKNVQAALKATYSLENVLCDLTDFNNSLTKDMKKYSETSNVQNEKDFEMPLLTRDSIKLNELASSFVDFRGYLNGYINDIMETKKKAVELEKKIVEEYHLK